MHGEPVKLGGVDIGTLGDPPAVHMGEKKGFFGYTLAAILGSFLESKVVPHGKTIVIRERRVIPLKAILGALDLEENLAMLLLDEVNDTGRLVPNYLD